MSTAACLRHEMTGANSPPSLRGESACRPGLVPRCSRPRRISPRKLLDLRIGSHQFSTPLGRSRGDVPPMCPGDLIIDVAALGRPPMPLNAVMELPESDRAELAR
jgi:hypothetical protein